MSVTFSGIGAAFRAAHAAAAEKAENDPNGKKAAEGGPETAASENPLETAKQRLTESKTALSNAKAEQQDTDDTWAWILMSVIPLGWPLLLWRGGDALLGTDTAWPPLPSESAADAVAQAENDVAAAQKELESAQGLESGARELASSASRASNPVQAAMSVPVTMSTASGAPRSTMNDIESELATIESSFKGYAQNVEANPAGAGVFQDRIGRLLPMVERMIEGRDDIAPALLDKIEAFRTKFDALPPTAE